MGSGDAIRSGGRPERRAGPVALMLLVVLLGGVPRTQAQPLRPLKLVEMQPVSLRSRSGGIIPVDVTLDWAGRELLEGTLEATFSDGPTVVGRCRSADITLTTGRQTFRIFFPAMNVSWEGQQIEASLQFATRRGTLPLGTRPLLVPAYRQRWLNICVSDPWAGRDRSLNALAQSLRFDRLDLRRGDAAGRELSVQPVHVPPEDLPEFPLGYCSWDLVLLSGEGFSRLRQRQLKTLSRWLEAGGSVCVVPQGELKPYHLDFLNGLTDEVEKPFARGADGGLTAGTLSGEGNPLRFRCGLGRAVVAQGPQTEETVDSPAWREATCFLWKIRRDAESHLLRGAWPQSDRSEGYGLQPIESTSDLVTGLLPHTARLVPMGLILLLLALFVLAIGPADYFLLGLLKLRKLTWVLFPGLCVALTVFMVYLSESYMGRTDRRTSVSFIDVGKGGRALRTNRYELIFAADSRQTATTLEHCLFTPLDPARIEYGSYAYRRYYQTGESGPPTYSGRIPTHYTAVQQIRKWTPQLNRIFSLEPPKDVPRLNWDSLDASMFRTNEGRTRMAEKLLGEEPFAGSVLLLHMGDIYPRRNSRASNGDRFEQRSNLERFIRDASTGHSSKGLFCIVSQISPGIGDNFEDLAVLDPTDPDQWLVAVVTKSGSDTVVYRRMYCGEK